MTCMQQPCEYIIILSADKYYLAKVVMRIFCEQRSRILACKNGTGIFTTQGSSIIYLGKWPYGDTKMSKKNRNNPIHHGLDVFFISTSHAETVICTKTVDPSESVFGPMLGQS